MTNLLFLAEETTDEISFSELTKSPLGWAIIVVGALILLVGIASAIVSAYLCFKYYKFNRKKNSAGMAGKDAARKLLDDNDLQKIKVKATGSLLFGNSYSHYFKKIRLRRLIWKKDSLTSMAMAAQKTGLAILDKEQDEDMVQRVKLTPLITFGPLAFIPIIVVGVILDLIMFSFSFMICTLISAVVGIAFMVFSLILQIKTLKTEIKAEEKAYELLRASNMATEQEIEEMKELFKLYNIEYINNIILAFLELVYRILITIYNMTKNSKLNNNN